MEKETIQRLEYVKQLFNDTDSEESANIWKRAAEKYKAEGNWQEAVECYDEALRSIVDGTYSEEKIAEWDNRLERIFNRGFWDGYYLGQRLGEWSSKYGSSATRVKVYAAKCIRYFSKIGVAEFQLESGELNVGDEIVITGPTTGALIDTVKEIRVDLKAVEKATKGERFSMPVPERVRPSDRLYVWKTTSPKGDK